MPDKNPTPPPRPITTARGRLAQLRKQGGSKSGKEASRGWKERWFVLTGSSLHYYAHPEAPTTKGTVELFGATVSEAALGEEAFGIVLRLAGGVSALGGRREVKLAAASAAHTAAGSSWRFRSRTSGRRCS